MWRRLHIQKGPGPSSAGSCVKLPAHPKRIDMNSRSLRKRLGEAWKRLGEAVCTPQRELRWVPGDLQIVTNWTWGEDFAVFRVPAFRLASLCYFWQNESGIQWQRVGADVGLVLADVINSVCEKLMYCPNTLCLREDIVLRKSPCFMENIREEQRVISLNSDWLTTWTL